MNTLDKVFAECKKLPNEDFGVLLSALMREQKERDCRAQKDAWNKVVNALVDYISNYGNIVVVDNRDGGGITLSDNCWTYSSAGIIEIE